MITALCSLLLATLPAQNAPFRGAGESLQQYAARVVPKGATPAFSAFEGKYCGATKLAIVPFNDPNENVVSVMAAVQMPGQKPVLFEVGSPNPKMKSVRAIFGAKTYVDGVQNVVLLGTGVDGKPKACVLSGFYDPEVPLGFEDSDRIPAITASTTPQQATALFQTRINSLWTTKFPQITSKYIAQAKKLNLVTVVPTYVPAGFKLKVAVASVYEKKYGDTHITFMNGKSELTIQMASEGIGDPILDDEDEPSKILNINSPVLGTVEMQFGKPKAMRPFLCTWYMTSMHLNPVFVMVMGQGVSEPEIVKFVQGLRFLKT